MGYYVDFATGRTLMPDDKVVAFAIAPVIHPALPKSKARNPFYTQDEYEALSLPIRGRLEGETFTPEPDQQSLRIFLNSIGSESWQSFQEKHLHENEPLKLAASKLVDFYDEDSPERDVVVAMTYLHETTFSKIIDLASVPGTAESEAKDATRLLLDARSRIRAGLFEAKSAICQQDHDPSVLERIADFGSPGEASYMPIEGWWIYTPRVMSFFNQDRHSPSTGEHLVTSIKRYHNERDLYDFRALRQTYHDAGESLRFMQELGFLGHVLRPSKRLMADNRLRNAELSALDLAMSLDEISGNEDIFADWIAHLNYPHVLEIRRILRETLTRLDEEIPRIHKGSRWKGGEFNPADEA